MSVRENLRNGKYWLNPQLPTQRSETLMERIITNAARFRRLTAWEEVELGHIVWENSTREKTSRKLEVTVFGDGLVARQRLVECNQRLVINYSKKYLNRGLEQGDICIEGMVGLQRGAEMFDPTLGWKFSTYATGWVKQAMRRAVVNRGRSIRLPVHISEKMEKIYQLTAEQSRLKGRSLRPDEVAEALGMSEGDVRAIASYYSPVVSLNKIMGDDLELASCIPAAVPMESVESVLMRQQLWAEINRHLSPEAAKVVWLVHAEGWKYADVTARLGIPNGRVRSLLNHGMTKLRSQREHMQDFMEQVG